MNKMSSGLIGEALNSGEMHFPMPIFAKPEVAYSVVIPVYGTSTTLVEMAGRVKRVFSEQVKESYELIYVNDLSPNMETAPVLKKLAQSDPCVRVITFTNNFGQQAATLCGINHARGMYIITMDDDLQHWPEDVPKLIEQKDHDVVIGKLISNKHGPGKKLFSGISGYFSYLLIGKPKHISLSSYRLFSRLIAANVCRINTPYPFLSSQLFTVSKDIVNVEVDHHYCEQGRSHYTFSKSLKLFTNLLINNSSLLLQLLGKTGIASALASFAFLLYVIYRKFAWGIGVQGWSSIMIIMLLLGGLLLFGLGIVGEYLLRILNTLEFQPTYVVRSKDGFDESDEPPV